MHKNKILVAHHAYFPSKMAHSKQILSMIEAIGSMDMEIVCMFPKAKNRKKHFNFQKYLQEESNINVEVCERSINVFPFSDELMSGWRKIYNYLTYRINSVIFTFSVLLSKELRSTDIIYTRHLLLAYVLSLSSLYSKKVVTELHDLPVGIWDKYRIKQVIKSDIRIGVISHGLMNRLIAMTNAKKNRFKYIPDAVSDKFISSMISTMVARKHLGILKEEIVIAYCGSLHKHCAPELIIEAMGQLGEFGYMGWIVGGHEEQINELKSKYSHYTNITYWGIQPHHKIPQFLSAADILVMNYASWHTRQAELSSPLKLYEYIAARKPIAAPALPSVKEVLEHDLSALLFKADDVHSLKEYIKKLIDNPELANKLTNTATNKYKNWTWVVRSKKLFEQVGIEGDSN